MFHQDNIMFTSPMGDKMYAEKESLIVKFSGRRGVVSTSNISGGYNQNLKYAFNFSCANSHYVREKIPTKLKNRTLTEYYEDVLAEIGLPLDETTGMVTAAKIENSAMASREAYGVTVMTIATAGIDQNGGRAGDKATFDEFKNQGIEPSIGTINIFLFINARLDGGVLTRSIVTATEAKAAILQELMANSMFSEGIATGSGTDSVIAICNDEANIQLFNAGKHVLLGQMIGESTKEAVAKALALQCSMDTRRQASIEWQSKRYGITKEQIKRCYIDSVGEPISEKALDDIIQTIDKDQNLLASIASLTHICDQNRWHLISDHALLKFAQTTINFMLSNNNCKKEINLTRSLKQNHHNQSHYYKTILSDTILTLAYIAESRLKGLV